MPPLVVLSHINAVNCNHILRCHSTFHPKGRTEGSSLEVLMQCLDSPLMHGSLLIKDIFKISACNFVLLASAVKPFPGVYTAQTEALDNTITYWPPSKHLRLKLWINVKSCQRRATLCGGKSCKSHCLRYLWGTRWVMNIKTMDKWPDLLNMKLKEAYSETQPKRKSRSDGGQAKVVHFCDVAFSDYMVDI